MKKVLFALCIVAYLFFHFFYLEKFLRVDIDDAYLCEPAWTFLTTGKVAVPSWRGFHGSEEHEARYGRIFIFSQLPFLASFGPRPLAVRLPALFSGFLLLWLTYAFGKYAYEKKVAALATVLLSVSGIFFLTTHHGRPDTMLALFVLAAFFLFVKARDQNSRLLFFCSGLVSTLSADVHLNGIMIFLSLGLLFLVDFRTHIFYSKNFWSWLAGATLGILWWVAIHVLVNPAVFWENWKGAVMGERFVPPILKSLNPIPWFQMEFQRYLTGYWTGPAKRNLIELMVILISLCFLIRKPNKSSVEKKVLLYIASFLILFMLIVPQKTFWYFIYLYPFFMLWIADMTYQGLSVKPIFKIILLSSLFLLYLANIWVWAGKYRAANYEQFMREIKETIPSQSSVMGDMVFWFGFVNYASSFASLTDAKSFEAELGVDFGGYLKYWDTDYLIVQTDDYNQSELERIQPFLQIHAESVAKVRTAFYGAGAVGKGKLKEFTIFKIKK